MCNLVRCVSASQPSSIVPDWLFGVLALVIVIALAAGKKRTPKRTSALVRTPVLPAALPPVPQPKRAEAPPPSVYSSAVYLLTPAECSFFLALSRLIEPECRIFSKVRLADIVGPTARRQSSEWWTAFNQTAKKHIDFVVCDARQSRILGVIELDDASHYRYETNRGDAVKDHVLGSAGVPLVRIRCARSYDPEILRSDLAPILKPKPADPLPKAA